ncbi:MAG: short-chain dehydrogenase [Pseudonocardia sp.]|jgi:NAD(P)-dependent dehydrogenase (short-subunit alcohol dehydrogenase family)|nr:short-chain dehydrogenase [Pseudonocardia sp.]
MTETTIALVTGANKGIGFATVRRLADRGWTVLLGARDAERGAAAAETLHGDVTVLPLDVTSDESVAAAVKEVESRYGRLEVLVNNAGIIGPPVAALDTGAEELLACYATNVFGPVRMTRAFLPLLRRSAAPRIVMVSSGMGSITLTGDPARVESTFVALTYPSSKAALNMITSQYARALPEFRINAADPGYTATDLNGNSGFQTVEEGSDVIVALATVAPDGPTGAFFDRSGPVPW